jgi:HSP20 family molecular chaperone IbpA
MLFATVPTLHSQVLTNASRSLERFLNEAQRGCASSNCRLEQDERSVTLEVDLPGIGKEHLSIAIDGSVVRFETKPDAPRQYRQVWELAQEIDVAASEARMEHGVLTLKLAKLLPQSRATELAIR